MSNISADDQLTERELKGAAVDHVIDNIDEYDAPVDYEALGAAVYTEDVIKGDRDDLEISDISTYIAENDVDDQRFIEYKADLADDYDDFVETMSGFFGAREQLIDDLEAEGVTYQALYEEALNERENAEEALQDITGMASDARTDSDWLENIPDRGPEDTATPDVDRPENPGPGSSSGGFSTWSNYNFGVQDVSGISTWSNYNFGTQTSEFADVEIEGGELNEDLLEEDGEASGQQEVPWIYNPQIKFSPTVNINVGDWSWSMDQAS